MILDSTTKSITSTLGGAASPAPQFTASYEDFDRAQGRVTSYGNKETASNGANAVTVVAAPAAGIERRIKHISLYNADNASITVTINLANTATATKALAVLTLATLETLFYSPETGWTCFNTLGQRLHTIT